MNSRETCDEVPERDERFTPARRLRHKRDFDAVFRSRCAVAAGCFVLHAATNELGWTRLGLSVSRRVGNAVQRNRWKRLLRESFRRQYDQLPVGLDLVVVVRGVGEPAAAEVRDSLYDLARRAQRRLAKRG